MSDDGCGELKLKLLGSWRLRRGGAVLYVAARQQRLIAALAIRGPRLRSYLVGLIVNGGAMLSLFDRLTWTCIGSAPESVR